MYLLAEFHPDPISRHRVTNIHPNIRINSKIKIFDPIRILQGFIWHSSTVQLKSQAIQTTQRSTQSHLIEHKTEDSQHIL